MTRYVFIFCMSFLTFLSLSSMEAPRSPSQGDLLRCLCESSHGQLQVFLYQELDKLWDHKQRSGIWEFVKVHAAESFHPVLLYFIIRTHSDYAYAFLNKDVESIPNNLNIKFDYTSRFNAFLSLIFFRIRSRVDADICHEFGFDPKNAIWIHEEFGDKLKSRVACLEKFNQKFLRTDDYIIFKDVFDSAYRMFAKPKFLQVSPDWISVCSKSAWRYLGAWSNTIYFNDVPKDLKDKVFGLMGQINERRSLMIDSLLLRIKVLAEDKQLDELEKWHRFLTI